MIFIANGTNYAIDFLINFNMFINFNGIDMLLCAINLTFFYNQKRLLLLFSLIERMSAQAMGYVGF